MKHFNRPISGHHRYFGGIVLLYNDRADQNKGGALLEFSVTTAVQEISRVSSAISICNNYQVS